LIISVFSYIPSDKALPSVSHTVNTFLVQPQQVVKQAAFYRVNKMSSLLLPNNGTNALAKYTSVLWRFTIPMLPFLCPKEQGSLVRCVLHPSWWRHLGVGEPIRCHRFHYTP